MFGEILFLLIDEVLDFFKVEVGKLDIYVVLVWFGVFVQSVVELLVFKVYVKGLEIGIYVDVYLFEEIMLDVMCVCQILFNLIGNGVKFIDIGGVVVELFGWFNLIGGSFLEIEVCDIGIGFEVGEGECFFQEFEQVDYGLVCKFGGIGFGFVIVQCFVGLMGGSIIVMFVKEGGVVFCVFLFILEDFDFEEDICFKSFSGKNVVFVMES